MSDSSIYAETFFQALAVGLLQCCVYALMREGLGLIFGVMKVINVAKREFVMLNVWPLVCALCRLMLTATEIPIRRSNTWRATPDANVLISPVAVNVTEQH